MKALKMTVGIREWSKLPDFVETVNGEDEMFAYQIDGNTAIAVTDGECGEAWVEALARKWFNDYETEKLK